MQTSKELERAAIALLKEAEDFCERAHEELDDLEAWGKEPTISEDWLASFVPEEDYFFSAELPQSFVEDLPRKERVRSTAEEKVMDASVDVSALLALAHPEDPQAWQMAIEQAIGTHKEIAFERLLADTQLSRAELLIGLLLGASQGRWKLCQRAFYGELLVRSQN